MDIFLTATNVGAACDLIAEERNRFIHELSQIQGIKVYPSQANFILCKLEGKISSDVLAVELLEKANIYIKDLTGKKCFDKPEFIRLAIRSKEENDLLVKTLKSSI